MSETTEIEISETNGSYRACTACHCRVHHSLDTCPECGAHPGDLSSPRKGLRFDIVLKLALVLFLAGSLYLLSRNPEAAREAELAELTLLAETEPSESSENPFDESGFTSSPPPDAVATPTPLPTTTPLQAQPTPTQVPFVPVEPTATPTPAPTAIPPTPTPPPTILNEKERVKAELRVELDRVAPLAAPGDSITLTLRNGQVIKGTLLQLETRQFKIESSIGSQWIPYRQLNLESRIRLDAAERNSFLEEKALEQILNNL